MDSRYYVKLTNKKLKNGKKIVKFTKIRGEKEKFNLLQWRTKKRKIYPFEFVQK